MAGNIENKDLEQKIINVAKNVFMEKGFAETSMSEIAENVGINRPVLHYYFRTKDKMFNAVFGMIIKSIMPKIKNIVQDREKSIPARLENIIDAYYAVFRENPSLPLFVCKEMNRDVEFLLETIGTLHMKEDFEEVVSILKEEMEQGKIKAMPLKILFLSFYSMLTFPFLTKGIASRVLIQGSETFDTLLDEWKPYIIAQMTHLLCTDRS